jgi:putative transposase
MLPIFGQGGHILSKYSSDLSYLEWQQIKCYFPRKKKLGRPKKHKMKEIVNAIFYTIKTGCQWELLPNDFPCQKTVYDYHLKWVRSGLWEKINDKLRKDIRNKFDKEPSSTAAIIDSQSVKSTGIPGDRGYDGGKKIRGRKRNILVDVFGLIISVVVDKASVDDRVSGYKLIEEGKYKNPKLCKIWADGGYSGKNFQSKILTKNRVEIEVIKPVRHKGKGFHVRPWCWIVERTFSWLTKNRRLSKEYECLETVSEALIYASMVRLMLRRASSG